MPSMHVLLYLLSCAVNRRYTQEQQHWHEIPSLWFAELDKYGWSKFYNKLLLKKKTSKILFEQCLCWWLVSVMVRRWPKTTLRILIFKALLMVCYIQKFQTQIFCIAQDIFLILSIMRYPCLTYGKHLIVIYFTQKHSMLVHLFKLECCKSWETGIEISFVH